MSREEVRGLKQQNRTPNDYSFLNVGEEKERKNQEWKSAMRRTARWGSRD